MTRRLLVSVTCAVVLGLSTPRPAVAQLVVNDPVNTIQNIAIVAEAVRLYQEAQRLRRIWETFSAGIAAGERATWTIPTTRWRTHGDVEDPFGTYLPLGEAFDLGDPTNAAYLGSVIPLQRYPADVLARLPATQRVHLARDYANVLMADGFGRVAVQTTSAGRWNSRRALDALQRLQGDFLQAGDAYNGNIGLLQKTLGARLISVQTTDVGNQLLASLLEGALTKQKIARDLDARRINADIYRRVHGAAVTRDTTTQMDAVLANFWRSQP